jgi:DNA methylase
MICKGKVALCELGTDQRWKSQVLSNLIWENQCRSDSPGKNGEGASSILRNWYAQDTLRQLKYLWQLVESERGKLLERVLTLIFSDVLFACTSPGVAVTASGKRRRHHWGWVADNVLPKSPVAHNAIRMFADRVANLSLHGSTGSFDIKVLQEDARQLSIPTSSIDLIVTSPPYVNVIDYTHANRLLYVWMGWPIEQERESEIGARYKRKRVSAVGDYLSEMSACSNELNRVLRPGGYCAVVLGESRNSVGAANLILKDLSRNFDLSWGPIQRQVSRQRVSERNARHTVEHICVFRKRK